MPFNPSIFKTVGLKEGDECTVHNIFTDQGVESSKCKVLKLISTHKAQVQLENGTVIEAMRRNIEMKGAEAVEPKKTPKKRSSPAASSTSSENVDCLVCWEQIPKTKSVTCISCDNILCLACGKQAILNCGRVVTCPIGDCKEVWTTKFIQSSFPNPWVNGTKEGGLRYHMKKLLKDEQIALLDDTIQTVLPIKKQQKKIREMQKILTRKQNILYEQISDIDYEIRELEHQYREADGSTEVSTGGFVCICPVEGCNGRVNSKKFKCIVCEGRICRSCREPRKKGDGHICDKDTVATLKLLRDDKNVKPCPFCSEIVSKVVGTCDQMFCTKCRTLFSWNTGKELKHTNIHNPHALQYMRENGQSLKRAPEDVPCGGLLGFNDVQPYIVRAVTDQKYHLIQSMFATVGQAHDRAIANQPGEGKFENIRVDYLLNGLEDKKFEQRIFLLHRKEERKRVQREIMECFRDISVERFRDFIERLKEVGMRRLGGYNSRDRCVVRYSREKDAAEVLSTDFIEQMNQIKEYISNLLEEEMKIVGKNKYFKINSSEQWGWRLSDK